MAKKEPGMLLIAAGCLAVAGALGYGAVRAFSHSGGGARALGSLLALGAFLVALLGVACIVLSFGVDFR
jgi:hypothetical protein